MDMSVLAGAVLVCVLGGVIPWINMEVAVIGAALLVPPPAAWARSRRPAISRGGGSQPTWHADGVQPIQSPSRSVD